MISKKGGNPHGDNELQTIFNLFEGKEIKYIIVLMKNRFCKYICK